ncbi:glyoxylate/hydroxypyruvate reductase [Aspergillus ellipticus CBS 707.79]|uniref:Glyoxylate/hydroxypyruvate reductase n=1 Tax=Aspergillus ellipticus CBS 707.79 TaxID=1448320 RepID=A0A319CVR5_9EURO|nr:glyoxylate/hydroxypyruvate reductase [Aspergillus ellipticus CBS 707.79]
MLPRSLAAMSPAKPSLLLIGHLQHCQPEWTQLQSKYNLMQFHGTRPQFLSNCVSGSYSNVIGLYRTSSTTHTGHFDHELIHHLPPTLKYIALNAAGYDGMDIPACIVRGIRVSNTPDVVANATADVAMLLLLGALRYAMIPLEAMLGILGMGSIGQALARRATGFGMKIIYHNRSRLPEEKEGSASYVTFDEILQQSDILSLNLPLNLPATPKTRHIISGPEFRKMKDGVVIINTGRGSLLDETALVEALKTGKVGSAGVDVYENEPEIHPELLENKRVMLLPHIGTTTVEMKREMELLTIRNLESALDTGHLLTPIPECS